MSEKIWLAEQSFILDYEQKRIDFLSDKDLKIESFSDMMNLNNENKILSIDGDTATINIFGILTKNGPDFIDKLFGFDGTSYNEIISSLEEIESNDSIKNVIMNIDSPGGEAVPVDAVWQKIYSLKKTKKITAINAGNMASAGYYLASAATEIKAESPLNMFGSIGTVVTTYKRSERDTRVEIVSKNAPNKRPDVNTKKGKQVFQDMVDALERTFISRISSGRGLDEDFVIDNFGQGSMMVAKDFDDSKPDAIKNKMADGFISGSIIDVKSKNNFRMETTPYNKEIIDSMKSETEIIIAQATRDKMTIEEIRNSEISIKTANNPAANQAGKNTKEDHTMSLKELLAADPGAQIEYNNAIEKAKSAGMETKKIEMESIMKKCAVYVGSADYKGIESQIQKVLNGESDVSALEGAVTAFDMMNEKQKQLLAQGETTAQGETKTDHPDNEKDNGVISSEADIDRMNAEGGK